MRRASAVVLAVFCGGAAFAQSETVPLTLRLAAVSRDAWFVETTSVVREGSRRSFRLLRIVTGDPPINGERYFGGWQEAAIDCRAKTYADLSFASVRESGVVGPQTANLRIEPRPIVRGGVEEGLRRAVCDRRYRSGDQPSTVAEAARIGRLRIEEETAAMIRRGRS